MNGICKVLDCYYGAQPTDDGYSEWQAIKVERDGNVQILSSPVPTEDEAEEIAGREHAADLQAHSQFGVGA
jgi:hypothetical protein